MSKLSRLLKCQRRSLISRIRLAFRISAVPPCFIFCCSCLAAFFCRFCAVCLGFCPALLCTFRLSSGSAIFPCIYRACPSIQNGLVCVSVPSSAPASADAGVVSTMQTAIPVATIRFIQFIFLCTLIFINPILPVKIVGDLIIHSFF